MLSTEEMEAQIGRLYLTVIDLKKVLAERDATIAALQAQHSESKGPLSFTTAREA